MHASTPGTRSPVTRSSFSIVPLYVQKFTALLSLPLVFAFMLNGEGKTSGQMWEFRNVQRDVL
jgi:hypothetical protein